ncbi:MAG TPA: hypothetical protein VKQ29_07760 [Aliidongia sp.]|nr:hypothetical protein [Aliidongia sp.]
MQTSFERQDPTSAPDGSKASRRVLYGFLGKLVIYAAVALPAALRASRPFAKFFDGIGVICVVAVAVCGLAALLLRQRPGDRALNQWDEALGFAGIYFLAHWAAASAIG